MKSKPEPTTRCSECYYFKYIMGVKTCGLSNSFLKPLVTGCYGGWKNRNIEAEKGVNQCL